MAEPSLIPPGRGEVIGDSPDRRVEVLSDHDSLHATWSRYGPGRDGADLHIHRRHTDLFYVLDGELTMRVGPAGDEVTVPAGTLVRVPPEVVHGFRNRSAAEVRYLNFHAPGEGFITFMRGLRDGVKVVYDQHAPPDDGGRPPSEAVIGGQVSVEAGPGFEARILCDTDHLEVAEVVVEPRDTQAPPREADDGRVESIYVLDGAVSVDADGRQVVAGEGSWIQVPPGVARAVGVPVPGPARLLRLRTPSAGST
jgi:quercetin dioxygenase-like cupin family protein